MQSHKNESSANHTITVTTKTYRGIHRPTKMSTHTIESHQPSALGSVNRIARDARIFRDR